MDPFIPSHQKLRDPKIIGQWKVGRTIGKGCSGRVRIARHSKTGQFSAIKIISKSSLASRVSLNRLADEVERERLAVEREIVVMKLIDHPNIMRLYDVWETSTHLFLILEYIQGGELFDHLCKRGPLPVPEALKYFHQIISAVDYFHRFNIAHRDLKPENILLDHKFNIKIADFGMAAWQIDAQGATGLMKTSCGSPHYAAPEIIRGEPYVGSSADIWSCGVILYAMLTAQLPFDDDNLPELLEKVAAGKFMIPSSVDLTAQNLIRRMLVVEVGIRITMSEIFAHPFFKLHTFRTPANAVPELSGIAHPLKRKSCIDPDIFANLRTLWNGASDEELVKSLLNEDKNWQKGIYHLLVNYRARQAEEDEVSEDEGEGKRPAQWTKRIIPSSSVHNVSYPATLSGSEHLHPPRAEPPTPRKARGKHMNSRILTDSLNSENITLPVLDVQIPQPALSNITDANGKSSLIRALPEIPVPEFQDKNIQAFLEQVVDHLNLLRDKVEGATAATSGARSEESLKLTQVDGRDCPEPLKTIAQVHIPHQNRKEVEAKGQSKRSKQLIFSLGQDSPRTNLSITVTGEATLPLSVKRKAKRTALSHHPKAKFEDKENEPVCGVNGNYVDVHNLRKRRPLNRGDEVQWERGKLGYNEHQVLGAAVNRWPPHTQQPSHHPPSEHKSGGSGGSPKRTWLDAIFRFKPTHLSKYKLHSIWDVITTRNECRRLLMNMNIHVQVFEGSQDSPHGAEAESITMKCKMDEARGPDSDILGVMKATKFRAEMRYVRRPSQRPVSLPTSLRVSESGSDEESREKKVVVTLIHEKGSSESFREIIRRLERDWTLGENRPIGVL